MQTSAKQDLHLNLMCRNIKSVDFWRKGQCTMKKIFSITVNIIPFFVWIIWFILALYDIETIPDLGLIQILLLLGLPLLYSIYNVIFSSDKRNFAIQNMIFGVAQVVGYYSSGMLYYNLISGDSETILVFNTFSGISIVYILIATFIFYVIRLLVDKAKNIF